MANDCYGVKVLVSNLKRCVFRRHTRLLRSAPEHKRGPYKHEIVNQSSSFTHNSYSQQDVSPRKMNSDSADLATNIAAAILNMVNRQA